MEENHTFVSNLFITASEKVSQSSLWTQTKMSKVCEITSIKKWVNRKKMNTKR